MNPLSDTLTMPLNMMSTEDQMSSKEAEQAMGGTTSQALITRHEADTSSGNTGQV